MLKGSAGELLTACKQLIQPLSGHFHKGQAGIITVIGGCADYTGAPYFACHAAAVTGADLSHVICEERAGTVIKSYSPDLMVHPYLTDLASSGFSASEAERVTNLSVPEATKDGKLQDFISSRILPKVTGLLDRSDVVVVGPGFGRDPLMLASLALIMNEIKKRGKPMIVDADALWLVAQLPSLARYEQAVLTPNVVEFGRLADAVGLKRGEPVEEAQALSKELGATVVRKGQQDVVAKADSYLVGGGEGSPRRVGGQGDTLVGVMATLLCWSNHYVSPDKTWVEKPKLSRDDANVLAIWGASHMVRTAAAQAFQKHRRSMQTSNVHQCLGEAYEKLFGE
ncbi:ATP-dependent (S)-NAD(P)H-hydrate dehydratase [Diutina catenulata]